MSQLRSIAMSPLIRFPVHLVRVIASAVASSVVTRRWSVLVALILGLVLVAVTLAAQSTAPLLIYPFA